MVAASGVMIMPATAAAGKPGPVASAVIAAVVVTVAIAVVGIVVAGVVRTGAAGMVVCTTSRQTQNRKQTN